MIGCISSKLLVA